MEITDHVIFSVTSRLTHGKSQSSCSDPQGPNSFASLTSLLLSRDSSLTGIFTSLNTPGELSPPLSPPGLCSYCLLCLGSCFLISIRLILPSLSDLLKWHFLKEAFLGHSLKTTLLPPKTLYSPALIFLHRIGHLLSYFAVNWWSSEKLNKNSQYYPSLRSRSMSATAPGTFIPYRDSLILTQHQAHHLQDLMQEQDGRAPCSKCRNKLPLKVLKK